MKGGGDTGRQKRPDERRHRGMAHAECCRDAEEKRGDRAHLVKRGERRLTDRVVGAVLKESQWSKRENDLATPGEVIDSGEGERSLPRRIEPDYCVLRRLWPEEDGRDDRRESSVPACGAPCCR